ncbi:MAG: AAA family ATPase [Candidatus Yanofskybacteria bacterium]|nr:AAA family ATPase [Candidatus Yanofskybacteria bacterium]
MRWSGIGHEEQKKILERLLVERHVPHALMLHGPSGLGKYGVARDIAVALLGDASPLETNLDFRELCPGIDDEEGTEKDIAVADARALRAWAYGRPLSGEHKVALIDEAHRLGIDAANTLLKVLEEPPAYLTIILVSSQPQQMLPTIASRCQELAFSPLDADDMARALADVRITPAQREVLLMVAGGRPGLARTLANTRTLTKISTACDTLEALLASGMTERILAAKKLADASDAGRVVLWWLSWVHAHIGDRPTLLPVAQGLLTLHEAVQDTKYNRRLAFERFLLEIPKY